MEDSLDTLLRSDDKEMLRKKLALLRREYNRTVQRLQRAERFELVRKHVRSRIAEQNCSEEEQSAVSPSDPSLSEVQTLASVTPGDSDVYCRATAVRFSLPPETSSLCASPGDLADSARLSDAPQPDGTAERRALPAPGRDHRRHAANRLRSRRSRQRWERREHPDSQRSESGESSTGQGDGEKADSPAVPVGAEACQPEVLTCSKEAGSCCPSLPGRCGGREKRLDRPFVPSVSTEGQKCESLAEPLLGQTGLLSETPEINFSTTKQLPVPSPSRPADGSPALDKDSGQQCSSPPPLPPKSGEVGCLDSCTMIEGLLFPVEYYVRTTRRMASAQSRVDLGAVIQSQLSHGRAGRGRRRRGTGHAGHGSQAAEVPTQPQTLGAEGKDESQVPPGPETCQATDTDCAIPRRLAGRRRRRGGGGRGRPVRKGFSPASSPAPSLQTPTADPVSAADLISRTENHVQATDRKLYPIFWINGGVKRSGFNLGEDSLHRRQTGADLREAFPLQPPGLVQPPLCLTAPPSGGGTFNLPALLSRFDVKDFHLPDDEFGMLKLDKLRSSVTASLDTGQPRQSPYNTRRGVSRALLGDGLCESGRLGGPVGSLPGTDCQWHIPVPLSEDPPRLPEEVRSRNSAAQNTATAARRRSRVRPPGRKRARSNFSEDRESGREPSLDSSSSSPLNPVGRSTPGSSQAAAEGEGGRGGVADCEDVDGDGGAEVSLAEGPPAAGTEASLAEGPPAAGTEASLAEGPPAAGTEASLAVGPPAAGTAPSPCVLNLSSSPLAHSMRNKSPVLPLLGSPTFPSLGVTPAFSTDSGLPSPSYSASPPLWRPVALPSAARGSQSRRAAPSGGTPPAPLCQTPKAERLIQPQNPPPADMVRPRVHAIQASANQSCVPRMLPPSFPDTLFSSTLASISQCHQSAPGPSPDHSDVDCSPPLGDAEDPYAPTPQITLKDTSSPLKVHAARSLGAETPSGVHPAPSLSPRSSQKGDSAESVSPSGAALLSPSQNCAEAGESEAPRLVNEDGSVGGASRESHREPEPLLRAAGVDQCSHAQLQVSPGTEAGDQDLDSYFTDSAWPSAGQSWLPCQPSPPQEPVGEQPEIQGMAPPTGQSPADVLQLMHTLKAPAGRCLVDVWGVRTEAGWRVVAAGEGAVSLWQQSSPEQWRLLHTWPFTECPVIALLPVPDAPGLLCAALGQLEIREARILCFGDAGGPFSQSVLCTGEIQAVLGVSEGRLVCCVSAGSTQRVTVAQLTKDGRQQESLSLVSPGTGVQAVAPVEGEPDALIGSTDTGRLVLWNMRTGHLLQSFTLGECLSGATCLRGYSEGGVLFVLLQHKLLSQEDGMLFSLIATNPITAQYVLAHSLIQPALCSGRFTDVDVWGSSLAVAFRCGTLATWDLHQRDLVARLAHAPEEGCNVVRWAGPSSLLIGDLSGDVFLYQYTGGDRAA